MAVSRDIPIPAPDDLQGWKRLDIDLNIRCADPAWFKKHLYSTRAVRRYFGHDDLDDMLERHTQQGVVPAYASWGILDYRPTATSKTRAEAMLDAGLNDADATLLRARITATPGIFRVASTDPKAGTVALEGVLQGVSVTVHDKLLSGCVEPNLLLVCRIFQAGNFWLYEMSGPPLSSIQGTDAIEYLRRSGMEFTPEGQRRDAHLFGRLWEWSDQWAANRPQPRLCNMDGDAMLWHTVSFSVADPEQTRRALVQRDDIEVDKEGVYRWLARSGPAAKKMGGPVSLGQLEFVCDELILTVNSARRMASARRWIEAIPGVAFVGVTTRHVDEPTVKRPLDESISKPSEVEMTPELTTAVTGFLMKQYTAWLDTSLPILNGNTPREACRTPAGRQQVAMLIRTIPDPGGPVPVRVPREALLRELGIQPHEVRDLQTEPTSATPSSPAMRYANVSRNELCPCGSGRKYKNCCGK